MKVRLKIENHTDYYTSDLRRLFRKCMEQEGVTNCKVIVRNSQAQTNYVHGEARVNGVHVWMFLPEDADKKIDSVAQVFIHELHHNLGLQHREMIELQLIDVSYVAGMKLRKRVPQVNQKPEKSLQEKRYEKALKMKEKYEKQIKQKQALLKKWNKKVKYYEKVFKE